MSDTLNQPVSVVWGYNAKTASIQPYVLSWLNRDFKLGQVQAWNKTIEQGSLTHHFSVVDIEGEAYFTLAMDASSLAWTITSFLPSMYAASYQSSVASGSAV